MCGGINYDYKAASLISCVLPASKNYFPEPPSQRQVNQQKAFLYVISFIILEGDVSELCKNMQRRGVTVPYMSRQGFIVISI